LLVEPVAVVSFLMTQRMLRGIRDRAERDGRHSRAELLDRVLDEDLPRYAEALERLGQ